MEQRMTIETFMDMFVEFVENTLASNEEDRKHMDFEWMEHQGQLWATATINLNLFAKEDE
jgi:hypothetical protein